MTALDRFADKPNADLAKGKELKIIGAGWGRTGTMSLKAALEILTKERTHHMVRVFEEGAAHQQLWYKLDKGEPVDLDKLMAGYGSSVDFPSSVVYAELAEHWPNAKVVLSVRDPVSWYKSAMETIYFPEALLFDSPLCWFFRRVNAVLLPGMSTMFQWMHSFIWVRVFFKDGKVHSLRGDAGVELVKQRTREWEDEVKRAIPADRLLVYRVSEGWEPLCKFLNLPVPAVPFPNVNDTAEFKKRIVPVKIIWYGAPIVALAVLTGLSYFAFTKLR